MLIAKGNPNVIFHTKNFSILAVRYVILFWKYMVLSRSVENCIYWVSTFYVLFGFPTTNFGLLLRTLHPLQDVNCVLFNFWPKSRQGPRTKVELLNPAAHPVRFDPRTLWSLGNASTHGATLPKDQPFEWFGTSQDSVICFGVVVFLYFSKN